MAKKRINREDREDRIYSSKKKIVLVFLFIGGIAGIGAVSFWVMSYETVNYNEYALKQNTLTKEIDDKVYEEGWHNIGFLADFIIFPSTWQTVEFSPADDAQDIPIKIRTDNGISVKIDISFNYRLVKKELSNLYSDFGIDYDDQISRVARGELRDVASRYSTNDFFFNRSLISEAMAEALVDKEKILFVEFGEFQLRQIDLPDDIETAIEEIEIAKQDAIKAGYELDAALIRVQKDILEAETQANISIIDAQAAAEVFNITLTAEGDALFAMMDTIGWNTTELLTYLWIQAIMQHDSAYLIIGEDTPLIFEF